AISELLVELHLQDFEKAFRRKSGLECVGDLAFLRYEELLEIGLSKVQCHLFFAKVSEQAPSMRCIRVEEVKDDLIPTKQDQLTWGSWEARQKVSQEGSGRAGRSCPPGSPASSAFPAQLMPPPIGLGGAEASSRKRAHSSHLSTGAHRGSERPTGSSVSAGSSSSSLGQARKRRRHLMSGDAADTSNDGESFRT
ncbi:unnamed protein product, partial [Polarella glacialis]